MAILIGTFAQGLHIEWNWILSHLLWNANLNLTGTVILSNLEILERYRNGWGFLTEEWGTFGKYFTMDGLFDWRLSNNETISIFDREI
jgi:hypothetical protein